VEIPPVPLAGFDAVIVRTIPAGSLEQIVFRMDILHAVEGRGVRVVNPAASGRGVRG
jgi:ribosomal protein S6--L-glutamate ligase